MVRKTVTAKVKASSLVEVLIAMVLIVTVFGVGMMIYSNVIRSSVNTTVVNARNILDTELATAEAATTTADSSYTKEGFYIERMYQPFSQANNLKVATIVAFDANHDTLAKVQKVLLKDERQN